MAGRSVGEGAKTMYRELAFSKWDGAIARSKKERRGRPIMTNEMEREERTDFN